MRYEDACNLLKASAGLGSRPGLYNITRLCALLGNPQDSLRFIHVAGTNGKGSTCAMLAGIGRAAGHKTGIFSSPFFEDYRESFRINGKTISRGEFAKIVEAVHNKAQIMEEERTPPTEFELLTACAFLWFFYQGCGLVVLEVGMGGALDSTNVIQSPLACVITAIGVDHTAYLGDTVLEIAAQKCGIIKTGCVVVSYPSQPPGVPELIQETAREKNCPCILPQTDRISGTASGFKGTKFFYGTTPYTIGMTGAHQVQNALAAIETARALGFREDAIKKGLETARLPARQEVYSINPLILLDGAHNPQGIKALAGTMEVLLRNKKIIVVMGMLADKQYKEPVSRMARLADLFIAATPENPRALDAKEIASVAKDFADNISVRPHIKDALAEALAACGNDGAVVVCGSLYLALAARRTLQAKNKLSKQS